MNRTLTSIFCVICITTTASALLVDFTSAEGYTSGDIKNQQNWQRVFGNEPLINVDASGSGSISQANTGGAIRRTFTDLEVGGAFDANASIIEYEFVIEHNTLTGSPTFSGMAWGIGDSIFNATELDIAVNFRDDGRITIEDGVLTGNDRLLGGFSVMPTGSPVTVTLTVDWGSSTYTATRSDTGATFTDNTFVKGVGGSGGHYVRLDSGGSVMDASIDSFSIVAIPEPTTLALVGISGLLALTMRRRR